MLLEGSFLLIDDFPLELATLRNEIIYFINVSSLTRSDGLCRDRVKLELRSD